MNKNELMEQVASTSFATHEAVLFLDTHPEDSAAMNYYQQWRQKRRQAIEQYEKSFGPLFADHVDKTNYWAWIKSPWPWELDGDCKQQSRRYSAMSASENREVDENVGL